MFGFKTKSRTKEILNKRKRLEDLCFTEETDKPFVENLVSNFAIMDKNSKWRHGYVVHGKGYKSVNGTINTHGYTSSYYIHTHYGNVSFPIEIFKEDFQFDTMVLEKDLEKL